MFISELTKAFAWHTKILSWPINTFELKTITIQWFQFDFPEINPFEVLKAGKGRGAEVGDVVRGQVHVLQRILQYSNVVMFSTLGFRTKIPDFGDNITLNLYKLQFRLHFLLESIYQTEQKVFTVSILLINVETGR